VKLAKTFFPFEGSEAAGAATSSIDEPAPTLEAVAEEAPSLPISPEKPVIAHVSAALPAPASPPANHLPALAVVLGLAGVAVAAMLLLRSGQPAAGRR
jgi:hypothetical protein